MPNNSDRIVKQILLRAPLAKVWSSLTDSKHFGAWFGVRLEGPFAPGAAIKGQITIRGYEHVRMELLVDRIEPQTHFSYRWHPYAIDPSIDYSKEPTTLVEFKLEEVADGVQLTVVESGFDRLPAERRAEAFRMNDGGWTAQVANIERHVTAS